MSDRILLIEDNPADAVIVQQFLERAVGGPEIVHVLTLADGLEELSRRLFRAVITDLTLPDAVDLEAVVALREHHPEQPIIVLTGRNCGEAELQALSYGAQDYLVKGTLSTGMLCRAVRDACYRQALQDENRRLYAQEVRQHRKLQDQNRRLRQLVRTAQRFVDNVSHEFRTPLTVIQDYAALLSEGVMGELSPEQRELLHVIADRTEDLNTMVNDMLDSSRLQAGIMGLDREARDVGAIVHRVCTGLERKALVRGITLSVDVPDDLPPVFCDAEKAGRIITNLAVNAIKFCNDPGHVRIEARNQPETSDVVISVTDNGPGLDASDREIIFERFRQVHTDSKFSTKGFGLGLSIVRELVELNLGVLSVDSQPGLGSTFSFTLPWDDPAEVARRHLDRMNRDGSSRRSICAVRASIANGTDSCVADNVNAFWKFARRKDDLVIRIGDREWLLLLTGGKKTMLYFTRHVTAIREDVNRNRTDEQLPQPRLRFLGLWHVNDEADAIVECVRQQLASNTASGAADSVDSGGRTLERIASEIDAAQDSQQAGDPRIRSALPECAKTVCAR